MKIVQLGGQAIPNQFRDSTQRLLVETFGNLPERQITYRWIGVESEQAVAHAAVQVRDFQIKGESVRAGIVGLVCTSQHRRRSGLGSAIMEGCVSDMQLTDVPFMVLNCGKFREQFYTRLGWMKIADNAQYLNRIDKDPVLFLALSPAFSASELMCDTFALGEDF